MPVSRRGLLAGAAGIAGAAAVVSLTGCSPAPDLVSPTSEAVRRAEVARRRAGAATVTARLTPQPVALDLGGVSVATWGYGPSAPGPLLRARAGDLLRVTVANQLPVTTSVHWHGIALRNDMDGVPGMTQAPIPAGGEFTYEFVAPDPGTYFYHPHSGVQLDRALYGVLVVDDPAEEGGYDQEWVVVLDDWVDGTGRTPDDVLASLSSMAGMGSGMGGMHHGGMGPGMETFVSAVLGGAGDVAYPHYLVNGRIPAAPVSFTGKPRQRARIRLVNASSDTAYRVALGGHKLTVTQADGFPVVPQGTDSVLIAMGERMDLLVTLLDGVFPLIALPEGKPGQALALVRTDGSAAPGASARPAELTGRMVMAHQLAAAPQVQLPPRAPQRVHEVALAGSMMPYRWTINGGTFPDVSPLLVREGERVRLRFTNRSTMFHPMHVHGHTFAVVGGDGTSGGPRKDTVIVIPNQTVTVDLDANNPGQWMTHCHNIYHAEMGMMVNLAYLA